MPISGPRYVPLIITDAKKLGKIYRIFGLVSDNDNYFDNFVSLDYFM